MSYDVFGMRSGLVKSDFAAFNGGEIDFWFKKMHKFPSFFYQIY